jgi:hypothetical protein
VYRLIPDTALLEQLAALPDEALAAYAEVLDFLQLTPWNGRPQHGANPDGAVRWWTFGTDHAGQIIYLTIKTSKKSTSCSSNGSADTTIGNSMRRLGITPTNAANSAADNPSHPSVGSPCGDLIRRTQTHRLVQHRDTLESTEHARVAAACQRPTEPDRKIHNPVEAIDNTPGQFSSL